MSSYCHNCFCECASARDPRYQFGSPEHLHHNDSTHSISSNEHVVVSNKVVSTLKNARSAHVEIPKVERFRMMEGRKGERLEAVNGCLAGTLSTWQCFSNYFLLVLVFLVPLYPEMAAHPFCDLARLFCMLALYGIYRVHEKGMKSAGAYCHGRCFTVELGIFPVRGRTAANISQK
jgi:hypothetical protein